MNVDYRVLGEQLKAKIKQKHGSQDAFAKHVGINPHNMAGSLSGNPVPYRMRLIEFMLENDLKYSDISEVITDDLINALVEYIIKHPDAVAPGDYPKVKTFFEVNAKKWRRTYYSEIINKKRFKPTSKLMFLCDHIGINIFEYLKKTNA